MLCRRIGVALGLAVGLTALYFRFLRAWHLNWGATEGEVGATPGQDRSELIELAPQTATHQLAQLEHAFVGDLIAREVALLGAGDQATAQEHSQML